MPAQFIFIRCEMMDGDVVPCAFPRDYPAGDYTSCGDPAMFIALLAEPLQRHPLEFSAAPLCYEHYCSMREQLESRR